MMLDYIPNINAYGDQVVRLYDFDMAQAIQFTDLVKQNLVLQRTDLDLSLLGFIECRNCTLLLKTGEEDLGIIADAKRKFVCELSQEAYRNMVLLLEPFCKKETKAHQMLYDVDSSIDFLFSPAGTW